MNKKKFIVLDMHEDYQKYKKLFKSLNNSSNKLSQIKCDISSIRLNNRSYINKGFMNHKVIYGKTKDGMSQSLIYFLENSEEK